jgi:outer membrane protein OmpA-like peptidoglycan-associated protein
MFKHLTSIFLVLCALIAGCSSGPRQNVMLDQARADYAAAQNNPQVARFAMGELKEAGIALDQANVAASARDPDDKITQMAYIAKQRVATAVEVARRKAAEQSIADADRQRAQIVIDQRTAEADRAKMQASVAQNQAANAQAQAANAQAQATAAQSQAADAEARARQLEVMLVALQAQKTERGMVITIGDVYFAVNRAELTPDGMRKIQNLADYMKQATARTVLVEGYTDSTGTSAHNMDLSNRRAESVATALASMGVGRDRIATRGYGEAYPVAGNDTAANRQLNRRVEIVLSEDNQRVSPRR